MAKDIFHNDVRAALEKEGWKITHDPLTIPGIGLSDYYIDLGAEKLIGAEKEGVKIAVEIKSFIGHSFSKDFHDAMGQYLNYELALDNEEPDRELYLAVPAETYYAQFETKHVASFVKKYDVHFFIFDPELQKIELWKK